MDRPARSVLQCLAAGDAAPCGPERTLPKGCRRSSNGGLVGEFDDVEFVERDLGVLEVRLDPRFERRPHVDAGVGDRLALAGVRLEEIREFLHRRGVLDEIADAVGGGEHAEAGAADFDRRKVRRYRPLQRLLKRVACAGEDKDVSLRTPFIALDSGIRDGAIFRHNALFYL